MLELKLSAALSYSFLWFQNIYQSAGRCRYYADIPQKKAKPTLPVSRPLVVSIPLICSFF